jgi:GTP-dependent dephospho-CoA kinase
VFKLKEEEREAFKKPFGKIYSSVSEIKNTLEKYKNNHQLIISIGDATTLNLIKNGIIPDIGIIDEQIERKKSPMDNEFGYDHVELNAANPAGTITQELCKAIKKAFGLYISGFNVLIVVEGEEDLAVLPCVITAPPGTVVLYGQPGEGVVLCEVDKFKDKTGEFLDKFEGDLPWKSI